MLWPALCQTRKADSAKSLACVDNSFRIVDEDPVIIEVPPQTSSCSGMLHEEDTPEAPVHWPRHGLVPSRINFSVTRTCAKPFVDYAALRCEEWQQRREAVAHLGRCHLGRHPGDFNEEAAALILPALRAAIRDEHLEVRATAAFAIGDLGPEAVYHASPVLWEACSDPEHMVRQAALETLQAHGQELPPESLRTPRLRPRSWHVPPALQSVREEPTHEDCQSECSGMQDLSTTGASGCTGEGSLQSSNVSARDFNGTGVRLMSEFTMSVGKSRDDQLGLDVDFSQKDFLKVLFVYDGIVSEWNKTQGMLTQIEPGDIITQVNGHGGSARDLMDMLRRGMWLEVLVQKPEPIAHEERNLITI